MRITKNDLEHRVDCLSKLTGKNIIVEYAYGKPRAMILHDSTGTSNLSPRLSKRELYYWLTAFQDGLTFNP